MTALLYIAWLVAYYASAANQNIILDTKAIAIQRNMIEKAKETAVDNGTRLSPNSTLFKGYKILLPLMLPITLFSILIGHVLGDCSITVSKTKDEASLAFEWGNKAYAQYVYDLLKDYIIAPLRVQIRVNANGNQVTTYCFRTLTLPCFFVFARLFIFDGVKTVPAGLVYFLVNPLALATWYMDDGGLATYNTGHGRIVQFNTQCFPVPVVQQMVRELNARYGFDCAQKWNRGMPIIALPSASYPKFRAIVAPYIHSSMEYKIPL